MIKKGILLVCALAVFGCSYGQNYLKNPETFIRDPHFTEYKKDRDNLELQYLHKEINYAQYIEQKDRLDATYDRQVKERNDKIRSSD